WDAGNLFDARFSPKAAVVYSPNARHSLRATFNQAFQTPNYAELFLDSRVSQTTGPRALERGIEGLFQSLKSGGLGPALANLNLPSELPWNFDSLTLIRALGNEDLKVERVTGWEIGYKATFARQSYVTLDAYFNVLTDFVTDLLPRVNPAYPVFSLTDGNVNVPRSLDSLEVRIRQLQQANQLPPEHAAVILATIAQLRAGYGSLAAGLGPLLATVNPATGQRAGVLSYTNAGRVNERGVELSAGHALANRFRLDGAFTLFLFSVKDQQTGDVLLPNTPRHKGSLSASLISTRGFDASATLRIVERFNWAAGIYSGKIPASQTVDLSAGYRVNDAVRVFAVGTNVFDQKRFSVYGGSVIGRRVLTGLTASF
ncbi:MAG TPA: TonB-dependent receptor, partial [Gemmatimonadaceae bacterium]|nr:TonB-dependent receptor [Gemmatimonadaceae bacterium]